MSGPAVRGGNAVRNTEFPQPAQQVYRARQRPRLVAGACRKSSLWRFCRALTWSEIASILISRAMARVNSPPLMPTPRVYPPRVDRQVGLGERLLPRKDVRVDSVDERPIQIEYQRAHGVLDFNLSAAALFFEDDSSLRVIPPGDATWCREMHAAKPSIDAARADTIGVAAENRTADVGEGDGPRRQSIGFAGRYLNRRK